MVYCEDVRAVESRRCLRNVREESMSTSTTLANGVSGGEAAAA
jgi:hypothetical protein